MENSIKKFAIFGCGGIAKVHAEAVKHIENAELVACADVVYDAAKKFASDCNIKACESFLDLLADENIDVINICTPNGTHAEYAIKALNANKNVVVEKPMATTTKDCDKIIEALDKSEGKLTVISQLRTAPDILKAREIVREGKLGKLVLCDLHMKFYRSPDYYNGSWKGTLKMDGGGALMNQGIHGVDLLLFIAGPIKNTKSIVKTLVHNIEVEDTAVSAVEFENGAIGVIEATTAINPSFDRQIFIHGTNGYMSICQNNIEKLVIDGEDIPCGKYVSRGDSANPTAVTFEEHAKQISGFIDVINGADVEYVTAQEGRRAVDTIERIYNDK